MERVLAIINAEMQEMGIDYHYLINNATPISYPYVTGELSQSEYRLEDGANVCDLLLEAWTRGSTKEILAVNSKIKKHFRNFTRTEEAFAVDISYNGCFPVRQEDTNLKKIEIHLDVMYWEGE